MKVNFGSYTYFDGKPSDGIYQGKKGTKILKNTVFGKTGIVG